MTIKTKDPLITSSYDASWQVYSGGGVEEGNNNRKAVGRENEELGGEQVPGIDGRWGVLIR